MAETELVHAVLIRGACREEHPADQRTDRIDRTVMICIMKIIQRASISIPRFKPIHQCIFFLGTKDVCCDKKSLRSCDIRNEVLTAGSTARRAVDSILFHKAGEVRLVFL